ncbi:transposase [Saccharopolyspora spinosa]|uniref:transposase n=1 Tax=Saccharopolyspora spinosa TaxID=60894 RepID=UPI001EEF10F9|nr:transposase [Saccharopolyspora spinosa]
MRSSDPPHRGHAAPATHPEAAKLYKKRGATVESVNGMIKDRHRLRRFSLRGLTARLGELNLTATTHNLRRLFTTLHTTTTT